MAYVKLRERWSFFANQEPTGKARTDKVASPGPYSGFWGPCPSLLRRTSGEGSSKGGRAKTGRE